MPFHRDHIDLLVSAAVDYGLLTNPVASALQGGSGVSLTPDQAGALLLAARPGPAAAGVSDYRFQPVHHHLVAVEVIKASHSYQHAASPTKTWVVSPARRLIEHIHRAATERLPGYAAAPWTWRRHRARPAGAIGLAGSWRPELKIHWLSGPTELARLWEDAALVVVTVEVAEHAAMLPDRPDVYVLAHTVDLGSAWPAVTNCGADVLITVPEGLGWLEHRIEQAHRGLLLPPEATHFDQAHSPS